MDKQRTDDADDVAGCVRGDHIRSPEVVVAARAALMRCASCGGAFGNGAGAASRRRREASTGIWEGGCGSRAKRVRPHFIGVRSPGRGEAGLARAAAPHRTASPWSRRSRWRRRVCAYPSGYPTPRVVRLFSRLTRLIVSYGVG